MWRTEPIDCAVDADERGGVKIADDAVVFNAQIHSSLSTPSRAMGMLDSNYRRGAADSGVSTTRL